MRHITHPSAVGLVMAVIGSGCKQMGMLNWVQEIVTGGVIVIAVALDRLRHRRLQAVRRTC